MSNISRLLTTAAAAGGGTVEAVGVDFDGTNDYLLRSSDMTGNADGKTFTFSCAVYLTTTNGTQIFRQDDGYTNIWLRNGNQLEINVYNTVGGWGLKAYADVFIPFNTWTIIIASFDMSDTSKRHIYFGDLQTTPTYPTFVNSTLDFTRTPIAVGANTISGISQQLKGRLSNLFLDYTYRDLSIESNRRLFIDADGKPASGQSSLSPILYLPMDNPADPGRNAGTGGDFTLNGIVARSGRGPNQYNAAASTFDGANDYLSKAAVTGMSDSKVLNVSFNFNMQSPSAGNILTLYNGGGVATFQVGIDLFGGQWRMNIQGKSSSTEILFAIIGLSRNFVNDRWQNYSISLDMANTSNRLVYIDGVDYTSNVTWYTYTNAALNITNKSEVMRESSNYVGGRLSALWFNPTYIDLSADNPFYDTETNSPKDLGASGELPTGSSPLIYLPLRANDAGNNLGTGGDFTVNSGPYVGARGPSEFIARSVITGSDGANLSSTGTNLSLADTNTITVAFAVKTDGIASQIYTFNGGGPFSIQNSPSNVLSIAFTLKNSTRYTLTSSINLASSGWNIVLISIDTANNNYNIIVNGVAGTNSTSIGNSQFDLAAIGSGPCNLKASNAANTNEPFAVSYFSAAYIDFSQESNRLKFVDALGYPMDLTTQIEAGDIPTPLIHMKFESTTSLGTNSGSGGDFTVNGTVTSGSDVEG